MKYVTNKRTDKYFESCNDGIMRQNNGLVVIMPWSKNDVSFIIALIIFESNQGNYDNDFEKQLIGCIL